ncbi:MAG: cation-transporting P-type ATPase [Clostridia bacterium]|nr:cation-transporting P-type ATPase [Clostridia bacterium]
MIWHSSDKAMVLTELSVDENKGLANGVAEMRLNEHGKNLISNSKAKTFGEILGTQLKSKLTISLFIICIIAFIISLIYKLDNAFSPLLVIGIVILNSAVIAYNLYRGGKAIDELKNATNPTATVMREGIVRKIPSYELVPGDIILLEEGDFITADARLIEVNNFRCNESTLTGESVPVDKRADDVFEDITPIEQRLNMVYSGCSVVHGSAKAVVVETGINTEIGRNATIVNQTGADTLPVENALHSISKIVNIAIWAVCIITFIIQFIITFNSTHQFAVITVNALLNATALAVAAVPEGITAISAFVLALGIQRIIKDNIVIKKAEAIETLGKVTVICADKTGILTRNKMTLKKLFDGDTVFDEETDEITEKSATVLKLACLCSTLQNDATEKAIQTASIKYNSKGKEDFEEFYPRLCAIPFDAQRKTMTSINMIEGRPVAIIKAAVEAIADKCINCDKETILRINDEFTGESLRVIGIAMKPLAEIPANPNPEEIEKDLIFVGILGFDDPPRADAIEGVEICNDADIRTIMITGDNLLTAKAVARRVGILRDGTLAVSGAELKELSDEELLQNIEKYSVYARVSPEDKIRIISAWQQRGERVAVTGDSLDDADALAAADIGCVMGKHGADVAKGNADLVIENNSFSAIVTAIKESRGLFSNIQKTVSYMLTCNFAELMVFFIALIIFGVNPLTPALLLLINLLTDCVPIIALSTEKSEMCVMTKRPSSLSGRIFDKKLIISTALSGAFMILMGVIAFASGIKNGADVASTMTFVTLSLTQIFHCFNVRTKGSIFLAKYDIKSFLMISSLVTFMVIILLSITPIGAIFGLTALSGKQFLTSLLFSLLIIPYSETVKLIRR